MRMTSCWTFSNSSRREVRMVEIGGGWGERNIERAVCPSKGRPVRRADTTESQKRAGSLSCSSRESQEITGMLLCAASASLRDEEQDATHAESSVVFPLPADAEMRVSR